MALKKTGDTLARKERDILWQAFLKRNAGMEIATWVRKNASELSTSVWSSTLHQGKPASVKSLLIMCSELVMPMAQVKDMLIVRGEKSIAKMLHD
ncbi:MAG: hypothetical protein HIU83_15140 [Proteobacteria bacterium]|nr:hypothetical protein [Pseudomonadota bacterium]